MNKCTSLTSLQIPKKSEGSPNNKIPRYLFKGDNNALRSSLLRSFNKINSSFLLNSQTEISRLPELNKSPDISKSNKGLSLSSISSSGFHKKSKSTSSSSSSIAKLKPLTLMRYRYLGNKHNILSNSNAYIENFLTNTHGSTIKTQGSENPTLNTSNDSDTLLICQNDPEKDQKIIPKNSINLQNNLKKTCHTETDDGLKHCLQIIKFDSKNNKPPENGINSPKKCDFRRGRAEKFTQHKGSTASPPHKAGKLQLSTFSTVNPHLQHHYQVYFIVEDPQELNKCNGQIGLDIPSKQFLELPKLRKTKSNFFNINHGIANKQKSR